MDALTITLLIVFATTAIGAVLQRRARDPCLKQFHGRRVFLRLKSGRWIWGRLQVYSKSLEIVYEQPNSKGNAPRELSYFLFEDILPEIQVLLTPWSEEQHAGSHRWPREVDRAMIRSARSGIRRSLRNIYNTLRDAFSQSIGVIIGQVRARNPAALLGGADQKLTSTGQLLVTAGNNAYEPILEKYLGEPVVTEMLCGEKRLDHVGLLEEYSEKYILLQGARPSADLAPPPETGPIRRADMIFPRAHSVVRHLAEREAGD